MDYMKRVVQSLKACFSVDKNKSRKSLPTFSHLNRPNYRLTWRIPAFLLFSFITLSSSAAEIVGSVAGEVSVLPSGASSYSVPLQVAPGIGGMTPSIALQYNSQSGNGLLGVGWSIGGLSAVHRCPQTIEQDGQYQGIQLNAEDRLCLDGKRLVPVYGNYSANYAEYRTEIDEYSKIGSDW